MWTRKSEESSSLNFPLHFKMKNEIKIDTSNLEQFLLVPTNNRERRAANKYNKLIVYCSFPPK